MEKSILQIPFKVFKQYRFFQNSQFWSKDQLKIFQNKKLIELIQHAYKNVAYYKNLFDEINLNVKEFKGLEDMEKIPLLDKEVVRTRKNELLARNSSRFGITNDSTSGSTGTPLHFILDDAVQANKIACLLRSFNWAGYRLRKRTLNIQSYYFSEKDFSYSALFNAIRFDSNRLKEESCLNLVKEMEKRKPQFIIGFPFDILMIAQFANKNQVELPAPKSIITYGETLSKEKRTKLEKYYRCKIFNFYSMHECSAMISECEKGNLHLIEDFSFLEVLDENHNSTSTKGSLVGTSYYNYSMPLIRYKIRDLVEFDNNICSCGRNFRGIKKIFGKQCDYIETPDGRLLGAVMSHSIDNAKGVVASQCIQNSVEELLVRLVVDTNYNNNSQKELEKGLRKRLGATMKIDYEIVPQLEKIHSGKTPFIISNIGNKFN